ncbi:response regulator [Pseudooctadecabacter jejudonensis]|uniref:Putative transcriptional regulatory protein pdtaR n=1 Tax=Pseudooctadecabacter jejudonensis TaxID=1391910 RepID=A0A1Y5T8Y7_9RHOB|nr:response regulator [Pseudooctadecabacter jejudonensis]SLN58056.1 putative transcriptional regulatory protein pdtaR [Pseudooctadecabacter jejudonensis]
MTSSEDFTAAVGNALPFLRRYGRALTGDQTTGDTYAAAALEALLTDRSTATGSSSVKVGLFKVFHTLWKSSGSPVDDGESGLRATAQRHLSRLTENTREALLLSTIEEFKLGEVAEIMQVEVSEAEHLVNLARVEMEDAISGSVMIIEDEAIIAMDLESVVADMGHRVTGIARTQSEAVALANADRPDLILSDIQLADNSSGIDATNDILSAHPGLPVIFITAFPERLLTGECKEPAFLISKPYTEHQVRSAVSQAMFFSSTETLSS